MTGWVEIVVMKHRSVVGCVYVERKKSLSMCLEWSYDTLCEMNWSVCKRDSAMSCYNELIELMCLMTFTGVVILVLL